YSLAAGDCNGDGILDLAGATWIHGTASVLLGNGDGTFQPALDIPVGQEPRSVAVGDFNGDGFPDLAVANRGSNDVSILLNDGCWPATMAPAGGLPRGFKFLTEVGPASAIPTRTEAAP